MRRGYVYVLHFDTPLHHAEHYTGCTTDLRQRLTTHALGQGSRLCEVLMQRGIKWQLGSVQTCGLADMRRLERRLKNQHEAGRYCELCAARDGKQPRRLPDTLPMERELIPWAMDSDSLYLRGRARTRVRIRLMEPHDPPALMAEVKALMGADRHALGFIPAGGRQGIEWSKNNGRLAVAVETVASGVERVRGFTVFTVGRTDAKIHQCCTADAYRDCGIGRRMVNFVGSLYSAVALSCWVRDDLAANEFWRKIGFDRVGTKTHKTSGSTLHQYRRPAGFHALSLSVADLIDSEPMPHRA